MGIDSLMEDAIGLVKANPVTTAVGAGAVAIGAGVAIGAAIRSKTKRKTRKSSKSRRKRIKHSKRGWAQDRRRRSKQMWEVEYQIRKRRKRRKNSKKSRRGIRYTKNGQPYKLLANGKARFIKRR